MGVLWNRKHLLVPYGPSREKYRPHGRSIPKATLVGPEDRSAHARSLCAALERAQDEVAERRKALGVTVHGARPGIYIQFDSQPGIELSLESLEDRRKRIELVAVQSFQPDPTRQPIQRATVFVPDGKLEHFFTKFQEYATKETVKGKPRHKDMVERIAGLRRATLLELWTDDLEAFPREGEAIWWEVWLRRRDGRELERFCEFANEVGLSLGERRLAFDDRIVVLVRGTVDQLAWSLDVLNDVAEVRRAKESAAFFVDMPAQEQAEWVEDLIRRISPPPDDAPAVCILDTGVTRGHPLLQHVIAPSDATAVDPAWGAHDNGGGPRNIGHGTQMAGLAAYGDLMTVLTASTPVRLRHRVESVKILPPRGANPSELYGAVTAQAVARPEIVAPQRRRVFSLAVTASDQRDRGQPTSWSAALDALAAGRMFDPDTGELRYIDGSEEPARRLFIVSAGNVPEEHLALAHLDRSDVEAVHDPAQAWNVLTVGAYTEKAVITHQNWRGWSPVSPPGELSPWSTTSVTFQDIWPIKPEVVFEGGNVAYNNGSAEFSAPDDLCVLSTYFMPIVKPFVTSYATSAATAQVARMAAIIQAEYPEFWPETVRALIVHSARWTPAMEAHFRDARGKRDRAKLLRRYGFGVPNLERALRSANNALTLVAQATMQPFDQGKMREMHLYDLPWPKEALAELGATRVRLRVTLSYFIEPNPGRRGWKGRYRYASHGFRFDVKSPRETRDEFRKRLNALALAEDEDKPKTTSDSDEWFLGQQARNKGSIHSDIWEGTAIDLAERGVIGVYPISGWWKDKSARGRRKIGARYALVVSIEVDAEDVDIWTPVAVQIGVPVESVPVEG